MQCFSISEESGKDTRQEKGGFPVFLIPRLWGYGSFIYGGYGSFIYRGYASFIYRVVALSFAGVEGVSGVIGAKRSYQPPGRLGSQSRYFYNNAIHKRIGSNSSNSFNSSNSLDSFNFFNSSNSFNFSWRSDTKGYSSNSFFPPLTPPNAKAVCL